MQANQRGSWNAAWQQAARVILLITALSAAAAPPIFASGGQPPAPAQDGFVPLDQLPPEEQFPAAPLVISAYAVAWLAVFFYLWSIWRRTARVERDLAELSRRIGTGSPR